MKKNITSQGFILGAVYLPHEKSDYYHDDVFDLLADDIVTIKATYDVPVILLGDFNSRVGTQTDIQYDCIHGGSNLEDNMSFLYFENHDLINGRIRK